ncbi:MAG: DUF2232 domain-containing protein [Bdellovibrionales bacterium]|nr:DUF2232 domain-containing protein [Bdellovibrionales bacterium]
MKNFWGIRLSHLMLLLTAVFLSVGIFVLATIPLFLLRISLGASRYIALVSVTTIAMLFSQSSIAWIPFLIAATLVGLYQHAKDLDCELLQAGLVSILGTTGLFSFFLGLFVHITDLDLLTLVNTKTQQFLVTLKEVQPNLTIDLDTLVTQIPSAVVMILLFSLWFGLLGLKYLAKNDRIKTLHGITSQKLRQINSTKLRDFELPGFVIWIALPVIAITFIEFDLVEIKMIAGNILNILLILYFFHGLSIIAVFFRASEVGIFWRVFWYIVLTVQMFLLVSSLGFADFWMNFRSKINKKPAKTV